MGIRDWLIKKLENDVERTAGHIDLESLSEEERNNNFTQFGEGDANLTKFLKTAYEHGAPSLFCCSGHGNRSAYVILKVTDENVEMLRKMGKVLSKEDVVTNFEDHYMNGKNVSYRSMKSFSTDWLAHASQILEAPELFDDTNPTIYYHEQMNSSYKPFGFDLKKKLLNFLRKTSKPLPTGTVVGEETDVKPSWELNDEEKKQITQINLTNNIPNKNVSDKDIEEIK